MSRLQSLFPQGFDSIPPSSESSGGRKHHIHSTDELAAVLLNYNPLTPSDSINVKSAWYGKQPDSVKHEFILIQIEDRRHRKDSERGLVNYLVLDRNVSNKSTKPSKPPRLGKSKKSMDRSQTCLQGGVSFDTFKVSYDGDVKKLLSDCDLMPHRLVERLEFPSDNPLPIYELVALAHHVSCQHPKYDTLDLSCYFFAGLIWEVLRELRPNTLVTEPGSLAKERGKHGWFRFTVPRWQVEETREEALKTISRVRSTIETHKQDFEELIQKRLAEAGKTTAILPAEKEEHIG